MTRKQEATAAAIGGVKAPRSLEDALLASTAVEHPCIGGDYCGRTTNGWFKDGSHGPGWYCGWCEAIPA